MNKLKEEFYKNWLEIKIGTPKFNGKTLADDIWNWINKNYISKEQILNLECLKEEKITKNIFSITQLESRNKLRNEIKDEIKKL